MSSKLVIYPHEAASGSKQNKLSESCRSLEQREVLMIKPLIFREGGALVCRAGSLKQDGKAPSLLMWQLKPS